MYNYTHHIQSIYRAHISYELANYMFESNTTRGATNHTEKVARANKQIANH